MTEHFQPELNLKSYTDLAKFVKKRLRLFGARTCVGCGLVQSILALLPAFWCLQFKAQHAHASGISTGRLGPSTVLKVSTKLRGKSGEILEIREQNIALTEGAKTQTERLGDLVIELRHSANQGINAVSGSDDSRNAIFVKLARGKVSSPPNQGKQSSLPINNGAPESYLLVKGTKLLTILNGPRFPLEIVMQYGTLSDREPVQTKPGTGSSRYDEPKPFFNNFKPEEQKNDYEKGNNSTDDSLQLEFKKIEKWRKLRNWPKSKDPKSVQV